MLLLAGCEQSPELVALSGETMGTNYSIKLAQLPDGQTPRSIQSAVDAALRAIDEQMSTWRPDSELSRFNASDSTDWFPVSEATATVVAAAQQAGRDSDGAFDATVMPLVNLWGFGPEAQPERIPSDDEIAAVCEYVGYEKLDVRLDPPALQKTEPRVMVDLSAIAPGYAVDVVAARLDDLGVAGFMVEIGGEVRTQGTKADGTKWRLGIEKPLPDRREVEMVVELSGESLTTSGDYRHYFERDGVRYSHTLDPRTGRPVHHALTAVTILADDCMAADACATTVMVLGPDEGYDWLVERDLAALLILRDGERFVEKTTPAFDAKFAE
ncbi:MAG: FAD:protein FMN transferase [Planctomycetaceae bacterium]